MDNAIFEEILSKDSLILNFVEEYKQKQLKLALFGAGNSLRNAIGFLSTFGITADILIDNDKNKVNKKIRDFEVIDCETFEKICKDYIVLILPQDLNIIGQIKKQLIRILPKENIYTFDFIYYDFYNNIQKYNSYKDFMKDYISEIHWLYENLGDEKSKTTLIGFLKGRITQDYKYYDEIYVENQYFDKDIIQLSKNETFLDCGAWDGDTTKEFIGLVGDNNFNKIYCFEPDNTTYSKLKAYVDKYLLNDKVELYRNAVWEESKTLKFNAIGEAQSSVNENCVTESSIEIEAIALDEIPFNEVTYIKMDIEGSEYEALKGASKLISKFKPKLGICVYHKYEDIITIPKFIKNINPNYKIFLRQHKPYGSELVLYALNIK